MSAATKLKAEIPYWGADLDPKKRVGSLREANRESVTGSSGGDYDKIPQQIPRIEVLVSTEHKRITPVFGTSCPPKGLSGMIRRRAFKYSEGRKAHWLLLMLADRVNVVEGAFEGLLQGRPDNPFSEMGLGTEFRDGNFVGRFGRSRADTRRWMQQALAAGAVAGVAAFAVLSLRKAR